jgi:putative aldouronate transport system permease protein
VARWVVVLLTKNTKKPDRKTSFALYFTRNIELYVMLLPGIVMLIVFHYLPIYGIVMAFQDYVPGKGISESNWVTFKHFITFFNSPYIGRIMRNTILLGLYGISTFPAPIIFALMLNEVKNALLKKVFQSISYIPYFISTVIVVGLLKDILNTDYGLLAQIYKILGLTPINLLALPEWFRLVYTLSGVWQTVGYGSIIYLAAISTINPELYESAIIDGAERFQQMFRITIPCIMPTITILFIFSMGGIFSGGDLQKILLMYSPLIYETADVIPTYIFRQGIENGNFSYSNAVGLLLSTLSCILVLCTNKLVKLTGNETLW